MATWPKPYEPEPGSFAEKILFLDAALTRRSWRDVCHTAQHQQKMLASPEAFYEGRLYYLSDGGYSRLGVGLTSLKVFVTGTPDYCRAEMDAALARSAELVADIESAVRAVLHQEAQP